LSLLSLLQHLQQAEPSVAQEQAQARWLVSSVADKVLVSQAR
jgi:hypothetical protein